MRLSFVLDGLENINLEKKSTSTLSAEQKKARLLLIKEVSELLDHARRQVAVARPSPDLADKTKWEMKSNTDTAFQDLLRRTKELINALQAGGG